MRTKKSDPNLIPMDGLVLDEDMCEGCTYNVSAECRCPHPSIAVVTFMELGMCTCRSDATLLGPLPRRART